MATADYRQGFLTADERKKAHDGALRGRDRFLRWREKALAVKSPYVRVLMALDYYQSGLTPETMEGACRIGRASATVLLEEAADNLDAVRVSRPDPAYVGKVSVHSRTIYVSQKHRASFFRRIQEAL